MPNSVPQARPKPRQPAPPTMRIGLALGGGSVRGMAHLGVLEVLEREGIRPAYVTGASAGSLVGALYCAGFSIAQMQEMARGMKWKQLATLRWPKLGLFDTTRMEEYLDELLEGKTFDQLSIPLAVTVVDILSSQPLTLNAGKVAHAVRASCAVPGVFTPVEEGDRLLVDGGLLNDVPVTALRQMGADYVIASALMNPRPRRRRPRNAVQVLRKSFGIVGRVTEQEALLADCLIQPNVERFSLTSFGNFDEIVARGRQAAEAQLPRLRADLGILWSPNEGE